MTAEDPAIDQERRSALAVLLRRTPFTMLLAGCTIAGVEAAALEAEVPYNWRLRAREGTLVLRNYGGGSHSPTWSVKTTMEDTPDGVRLEGRLRYLGDRIATGLFLVFTLFLFGVGAWLGVAHGPRHHEYVGALGAGLAIAIPASLLLFLMPRVARRRQARVKEILQDIFVDR